MMNSQSEVDGQVSGQKCALGLVNWLGKQKIENTPFGQKVEPGVEKYWEP